MAINIAITTFLIAKELEELVVELTWEIPA